MLLDQFRNLVDHFFFLPDLRLRYLIPLADTQELLPPFSALPRERERERLLRQRGVEISLESVAYDIPVKNIPDGSQIVGAAVTVIYVIGVLPDIKGQDWLETVGDRVACIGILLYH